MAKAEVIPFLLHDAAEIEPLVRHADRQEISEALGIPMLEALQECALGSCKASKIVVEGRVVAVFGDAIHSILGQIGVPWLISTINVERYPKAFLRVCKPEVAEMLTRHRELINFVDIRNTAAIRWLKWLGFDFSQPEPYGPHGHLFHKFTMTREG